jgi:uncharacterized protein YhaN
MRLVGLYVDGYGILRDFTLTESDLFPSPCIIYGLNEAGKSTLLSFIRAVLFGFKSEEPVHVPVRGGRTGGYLLLEDGGQVYRVERYGRGNGRAVVELPDGRRAGDELLRGRVLRGMGPVLFRNVFAFGMDEMRRLEDLAGDEVSAHIYGAGTGTGPQRLASAVAELERRTGDLFKPRGKTPVINKMLIELENLDRKIRELEQQPARYFSLRDELLEMEQERDRIRALLTDRQKRLRRLDSLLKARAPWNELQGCLAAGRGREPVDYFPEDGLERLSRLEARREEKQAEVASWARRAAAAEEKLASLAVEDEIYGFSSPAAGQEAGDGGSPAEGLEMLEQAARELESLRHNRSLQHLHRQKKADLEDRRRRAEESLQALPGTPSRLWPVLAAALLGCLGLGVLAVHTVLGLLVLGGSVGLGALLYGMLSGQAKERLGREEALRNELRDLEKNLAAVEEELARLEEEYVAGAARLRRLALALTGRDTLTWEEIPRLRRALLAEQEKRRRQRELIARVERLTDDIKRLRESEKSARENLAAIEAGIQELLTLGGAAGAEDFRRRAAAYREQQSLARKIEMLERQLLNIAGSPAELEAMRAELTGVAREDHEAEAGEIKSSMVEMEQELVRLGDEIAAKKQEMKELENGEELARARQQRDMLRESLAARAREWQAAALCAALLETAREKHERERQPAVLARASRFIGPMTEGQYTRTLAPAGAATGLEVEEPGGRRVPATRLSRGAAGQLYLAVRLALAGHFSEVTAPMPIILDDIMVDSDAGRLRGGLEVLDELSREHQVIFFTCHEHILETARKQLARFSLVMIKNGDKVAG